MAGASAERATSCAQDSLAPPLARKGTAMFLTKTISKLSLLAEQSKRDLLAAEEEAEQKRQAEARKQLSLKRENSMAGLFKRKATLPRIDMKQGSTSMNAKARGSVFGLSTARLLKQSHSGAEKLAAHGEEEDSPAACEGARRGIEAGLGLDTPQLQHCKSTVVLHNGPTATLVSSKSASSLRKKGKMRHTVVNDEVTAKEVKPTLMGDLRKLYKRDDESDWNEGDATMDRENSFNSDKSLLMRESLKFSQKLRALVTMVWLAAKEDSHIELKHKMTKAQYLLLNRKLQICVLGEFDETEGQALAESDWERDTKGKDFLDFEGVFQSFELVDMWTDEISEPAYCIFMEELVQRMIHKSTNHLQFREDDNIVSRRLYLRSKDNFGVTTLTVPATPSEVYAMYAPKPTEPNLSPLRPANVWSQIDTSIKGKRGKGKQLRF